MTNMPVCRISGQPLHAFLDLGMMPVANAFLTKAQLAEPEFKFPLRVGFCETSLMVQLIETVDPAQLFHANYAYFSSISRVMEQHFAQLADAVAAEFLYDKVQSDVCLFAFRRGAPAPVAGRTRTEPEPRSLSQRTLLARVLCGRIVSSAAHDLEEFATQNGQSAS